ncbi:MAG TPA: enoyl-CoA hydratase/isomerase family protein, partial [Burkholderiaceae bacterium]
MSADESSAESSVEIRVEDRIATVLLNRPHALNAIDAPMRRSVQDAWQRIAADDDILVAIVVGAGDRAFSAGADLKNTPPPAESFGQQWFGAGVDDSLTRGMEMDKPLVCAFNGLAYGGGLEIGLGCDIRIAAEGARFALAEVRVGTLPGS